MLKAPASRRVGDLEASSGMEKPRAAAKLKKRGRWRGGVKGAERWATLLVVAVVVDTTREEIVVEEIRKAECTLRRKRKGRRIIVADKPCMKLAHLFIWFVSKYCN